MNYFHGRDLFDSTKKITKAYLSKVDEEFDFEVPVLRDAYGLTALHICLGIDRP